MNINNFNNLNSDDFDNNLNTKYHSNENKALNDLKDDNTNLKQEIDKLLEDSNQKLKSIDKEITYTLHDKVNRYIITVKDRTTGEVIRECPPKEQLDIFARILENSGVLLDESI